MVAPTDFAYPVFFDVLEQVNELVRENCWAHGLLIKTMGVMEPAARMAVDRMYMLRLEDDLKDLKAELDDDLRRVNVNYDDASKRYAVECTEEAWDDLEDVRLEMEVVQHDHRVVLAALNNCQSQIHQLS